MAKLEFLAVELVLLLLLVFGVMMIYRLAIPKAKRDILAEELRDREDGKREEYERRKSDERLDKEFGDGKMKKRNKG